MIFCSSQPPFDCSPTCPLLVEATLLCPWSVGTGLEQLPFLSFLLERTPTSYLAGSGLGPRVVGRLWAGEGTGSSSLIWLSSGCRPSLSDSQLGERSLHYISIICDSHTPMAQDPSTLGHPDLWL